MQGEIVLPREVCGDFARLCSASALLGANQSVQFCPGLVVQATIIAPLGCGLAAEAVEGTNVQQNNTVGGRGLRARLFSTGARLWGTSAIASARLWGTSVIASARRWGTSAIARRLSARQGGLRDRLSVGGAGGVLSARLFSAGGNSSCVKSMWYR